MKENQPSVKRKKVRKPPLTAEQKEKKKIHNKYLKDPALQDANHRKFFSKPAKTCTLCGYPMDYNGHKLTEWEEKWSTHEPCRDKAHGMLDRETGIARERRRK